ncbi:baculoviral IAP repeat-containing protein 3-like isoform X2 [Mytilus californianus]|uniref:baculoviral IAP repeat-containing protein 3-like isoform X2 n=1 Tax=Mytilus californianus TaxID=6549 RepID=UPI0022457917|nr:baculoviral IAP repeat-containing protein 3-like isoform X2 [Mytilus californianus]
MHSIMDKYFNSIANSQRTNDSMSIEMLRLFSLRNFPRNINISMVRLAGAGFYSTGNSTETKCFLCEVIYRDWISGDDPMHIHRHISPTCDLVANGNRQDTIGEELQNVRRQERLEVHPSNLNGLSTGNVTLHSNENVCSSNVLTNGQQNDDVSDITSSAIHFHHHDIVEDQPTVFSTREAQIHDSNTNSNKTPTSNCKNNSQNIFIKNNSTVCNHERGSSNNHEDIGIHTQIPRYINYAPLHVRISSYEGWPGYLNQTPGEMALAGFLFAGYNDYTRCFHCGGGLRNWEAGDDPWVEHARWFPQCGFLKQNKGQNFIQAVLKKHNTDPKSNGNCSYSHKQSQEYHTGTPDKNTTTVSASSLQVSRFNVQEQANNVTSQERSNRINTLGEGGTDVSATDIMNVLLKEDHQRTRQVSNVPETRTAEGIGGVSFDDTHLIFEENRQLQEQRQCKVCKEFDSTIAFLPCGHIVCCTDCAPAMRKCPICKTYVKGTVKTYLA